MPGLNANCSSGTTQERFYETYYSVAVSNCTVNMFLKLLQILTRGRLFPIDRFSLNILSVHTLRDAALPACPQSNQLMDYFLQSQKNIVEITS